MRKQRMIIVKRTGWRFGLGPGRHDIGVDVYPSNAVVCCTVM